MERAARLQQEGSPRAEHLLPPWNAAILVEKVNGISGTAKRHVDFLHIPVPKARPDEAYYARSAMERRFVGDFGSAVECGRGRNESGQLPGLLKGHRVSAEGF